MALRINSNIASMNAIRNLHVTDRRLSLNLAQLSSGLRTVNAGVDPGGVVRADRLGLQIAALEQNVRNAQDASNLIGVAEAALGEISGLLEEIVSEVEFSLSTGSNDPASRQASQDAVDQAIQAIDRIANTTRYGDRDLLNGNSEYRLEGDIPAFGAGSVPGLTELNIRSLNFVPGDDTRTLSFTLVTVGERASVVLGAANAAGTTVLRVTGSRGAADVTIGSSAAAAAVHSAINAVANQTGVFVSGGVAYSEGFGEDEFISIEVVSNGLAAAGLTTQGAVASDAGADAELNFNGALFTGNGLEFSVNLPDASLSFSVSPDSNLAGNFTLEVHNTGLLFQLRENAQPGDQMSMGINGVTASQLGFFSHNDFVVQNLPGGTSEVIGGFLNSLKTGGDNDLNTNADNALVIVQKASEQVAELKGFLGAAQAYNLNPMMASTEVAIENLAASRSSIQDLDFASATAEFTRNQIIFQSGISALASSRIIPQAVIQLLG